MPIDKTKGYDALILYTWSTKHCFFPVVGGAAMFV